VGVWNEHGYSNGLGNIRDCTSLFGDVVMFGIDDAITAGLKVIDKFIPDPEAKAKAESELRDSLQAWDKGQMAVNKAEASSGNAMAATWRPAIGWICALALGSQYLITPWMLWGSAIFGVTLPAPPTLDNTLWELMFGMLGFGGLRTFEKLKGVAK